MSWRPEDWKNPNPIIPELVGEDIHCNIKALHGLYEDGADAMLKAVLPIIEDEIRKHTSTVSAMAIIQSKVWVELSFG